MSIYGWAWFGIFGIGSVGGGVTASLLTGAPGIVALGYLLIIPLYVFARFFYDIPYR